MNLQNQINQVLKKARALKQWIFTGLKSLDLKNKTIQTCNRVAILLRQTYNQTLVLLGQARVWTLKTLKHIKKLAVKSYRKTREGFLLSIDYAARKKFLFKQWSIKYIKPLWDKFRKRAHEILLHATEAALYIIKTISQYLWQQTRDFTKYTFKQLRALSIATYKTSKSFLLHTGIFTAHCIGKSWYYTKISYRNLIKGSQYSWHIFKLLMSLLYKYSKVTAVLCNKALGKTATFITLCLNKLYIFLKHTFALSGKYSLVVLRLVDRGFKNTGILLTRGLLKTWQVLILFGQGLLIIISHLWHLSIRIIIRSLKTIDSGFKKTGFFLTYVLVKTWHFFTLFIHLLATAINRATEFVLTSIVKIIQTLSVFLWRSLKYLLWSPVILLNFILPRVVTNHLKQYALLIRLDKPIGILLLLWPTLIALWIAAEGWPDINVLMVFVAGVFLMRSAGCAINDYADRNIDPNVERTKNRPLASRAISVTEALVIFVSLCVAAFMLVLMMNGLTVTMSFIGLALAATYPFMKRYHYLPQVHLGAAFGWAVPMAFAAQANELAPVAWLLFFATVLWATAYDTMYAMVDREDDILIGAKSTAILFEDADTLIIGIIQAILILCLIMIGVKAELGGLYFLSVLIATGFAAWQQFLIKDRKPSQCFQAFMNNNWFGLILFAGVFLEYQVGGIST